VRLGYTLTAKGAAIDAAFDALAARLASGGRRVAGAVQATERDAEGRLTGMALRLLPDGPEMDIAQHLGAAAGGCRLDTGKLAAAVQAVSERIDAGADLVILPRFGEREAEGGGFRDAIARALMADIPVLVGVGAGTLPAFLDFAGGAAERVDPAPEALLAWAGAAPGGA